MRSTHAWAADGSTATPSTALHRTLVERRDLRADDIAVRVDYCGVCHSDLHALHEHGAGGGDDSEGPLVPGHEFTGVVTEIGPAVRRFRVGDAVAVGNIVDACLVCDMCTAGQENFCREFPTLTYGGVDRRDGTPTLGAFAREYIVARTSPIACRRGWTRRPPPRCCARGSPCGNRCGRSPSGPGRASPWWAWAGSGTSP